MKRVLLIEDDGQLCELIAETLTFEGFDPMTANSVYQGIELATNYPPDLILCDWSLPDGSALDILQSINNHNVVVITGHASIDKIDMALAHGAQGYLMKPFTQQELLGAVFRVLRIV